MIISLIAAMDEGHGIGVNGGLPWYLSADLKRFKSITMGHHLIMGRKTYDSIGKPLPGRTMIILSRNPTFQPEGCIVARSLADALDLARKRSEDEAFVIGGGDLFAQTIGMADRIYLTKVHATLPSDVYFPEFDPDEWKEIKSEFIPADAKNEYASTFMILDRKII